MQTIKKAAKAAVRWVTAWAWRREIDTAEGVAAIEEMHATPGKMNLTIRQTPAQSQWVAQCFAELVASSPNYTEIKFDLVAEKPDSKFEWITVLVQKGSGKTPHQLRRESEEKLAILEAKLLAIQTPPR